MAVINQPGDQPSVAKFLRDIERIDHSSFPNDGERSQALLGAYALVSRLESPWDTVARLGLTEPALLGSLKVARDIQLFEKWHEKGNVPRTSEELTAIVSCDGILLQRILCHFTATNILQQVSPGTYKQTPFSISLLQPVFSAWIDYAYDATIPCFHKLPEYLARNEYKNPSSSSDTVFQYTKGCKEGLFEYYDSHPRESKTFNDMMGGVMAHQAGMLDLYPYQNLVDGSQADCPLLVDVGGNVGHDLRKFLQKHPETAHHLVLQDRAEVLRDSKCPPAVKLMPHDFFAPQPVKGARAYYLHGVLHDWPDKQARQILQNLKEAMTPGYSKLLVHDHVIPASHPHPHTTAFDLTMMVKLSALERTESMWQELLTSVGLRIVRLWTSPLAAQSIIEAELWDMP